MIPSYFKIETLAIRDEFVKQGYKELLYCHIILIFLINRFYREEYLREDSFRERLEIKQHLQTLGTMNFNSAPILWAAYSIAVISYQNFLY